MSNENRIITWRKWVDPLGRNQDEFEYIPEKDVKNFDNDPNELYEMDRDDEDDDTEGPTPVVITPMGILPLKPFNDPTKVFNFWLGETNFDITPDVRDIINDTEGVEILDIFTRYKFRIAIGNNFQFQNVRQAIEKNLDASPLPKRKEPVNMVFDDKIKSQIQGIIQTKLSKFDYWAIYLCPNGELDMSYSKEKSSEFDERIELYVNAKRLAGGCIFKYDDPLI